MVEILRLTPYLSALDFRIMDFRVYFKLKKKSSSKPIGYFVHFEIDFWISRLCEKSSSTLRTFFGHTFFFLLSLDNFYNNINTLGYLSHNDLIVIEIFQTLTKFSQHQFWQFFFLFSFEWLACTALTKRQCLRHLFYKNQVRHQDLRLQIRLCASFFFFWWWQEK